MFHSARVRGGEVSVRVEYGGAAIFHLPPREIDGGVKCRRVPTLCDIQITFRYMLSDGRVFCVHYTYLNKTIIEHFQQALLHPEPFNKKYLTIFQFRVSLATFRDLAAYFPLPTLSKFVFDQYVKFYWFRNKVINSKVVKHKKATTFVLIHFFYEFYLLSNFGLKTKV